MADRDIIAPISAKTIRGSGLADLAAALALAGLPADDIAEPGRTFLRFEDSAGQTVGFGGWELHGSNILLRSITVPAVLRGRGLGCRIVDGVLSQARGTGAANAYLLTTSAQEFFAAQGFEVVTPDAIPAPILKTRQATRLCPASAVIMTKKLSS